MAVGFRFDRLNARKGAGVSPPPPSRGRVGGLAVVEMFEGRASPACERHGGRTIRFVRVFPRWETTASSRGNSSSNSVY